MKSSCKAERKNFDLGDKIFYNMQSIHFDVSNLEML